MMAILIDPELRQVMSIDLPDGGSGSRLTVMRGVIGCDSMDHITIDDMRDSVWVDDNGLKRGKPIYAFRLAISPSPIAGKAIVIGADEMGRTQAPYITIEFLREEIEWLGLIIPEVDWVEEPDGLRAVVTYSRPKEGTG
jgi:hypothetical protein